ncbi:MAG: PP2C family protein-serine/threonine phosphatase [Pseudomonadales bacterium]
MDDLNRQLNEYAKKQYFNPKVIFNPFYRIKITHFLVSVLLVICALFFIENLYVSAFQVVLAVLITLHDLDDSFLKKMLSSKIKQLEAFSEGLEEAVEARTREIVGIKKQIEIMHDLTKDSIEHASLIQHSIIPSKEMFTDIFDEHLILWHPKDVVGGDIYLLEKLRHDDECLLMVIDCTGHGVPGAFVTMLVKAIERQLITNIKNGSAQVHPAKILQEFSANIKFLLKQNEKDSSISNAGFDGGIVYYDRKRQLLRYAGAQTPLFIYHNGEVDTYKGDRQSIGYVTSNLDYEFNEHEIQMEEGMEVYLSTDGYFDQNGGTKGFPMGKKRFLSLLDSTATGGLSVKKEHLIKTLLDYQGDHEKTDDITVVGVKIPAKAA